MKKTLIVFGLLVLIGGGCAKSPEVTKDKTAESEQTTNTNSNDSSGTTIVETIDKDGNKVRIEKVESGGAEMVFLKDLPKTEDGIEIVDFVLGGNKKAQEVSMESKNYSFTPNVINASLGEQIKIPFKNSGFHTFVIDGIDLKHSIVDGESIEFTAPTEPGSYSFYCDIGSHRKFGMEGTLIVK